MFVLNTLPNIMVMQFSLLIQVPCFMFATNKEIKSQRHKNTKLNFTFWKIERLKIILIIKNSFTVK